MLKYLVLMLAASAAPIQAQSALEHHAWQTRKPLVPMSRTAIAIAGPVTVRSGAILFGKKTVAAKSLTLCSLHVVEVTPLGASLGYFTQLAFKSIKREYCILNAPISLRF